MRGLETGYPYIGLIAGLAAAEGIKDSSIFRDFIINLGARDFWTTIKEEARYILDGGQPLSGPSDNSFFNRGKGVREFCRAYSDNSLDLNLMEALKQMEAHLAGCIWRAYCLDLELLKGAHNQII